MVNHKIDMNRYEWELNNLKDKPKKENAVCFYGSSTFAIWKTLEEEFKISIPDEAIPGIVTVGDLVKYIESNKK